ncbi:hypothetical protein L208DRAFT_1307020 [Tricholoma matsutake]|nr:hypothetical protein L208DRAFT_1307020 [Tricholoma matsutake 945]
MSLVAYIGPLSLSSSLTYAGVAGLSFTACFGIIKLIKDLWRFRRAEAGKNAELSWLHRSLTATRSDAETKEEELAALRSEFDRVKSELEELEKLLESTRKQNKILEGQVKQQTEKAQLLKDEALQIKTEHAQTVHLLKTRTLELKGAEAFLTKTDALSGADIIRMLNTLNSEIYQTAALVAESFEFKEQKSEGRGWREGKEVEMVEVYASATEILGPRMVELLKTSEHHEDPTLIQIAFQAGMSAYTNWILTSWYFDDPEDEHLIREIYMRVREAEEQAVSGRWRSLTRAHVQRMTDHEPDLAMYFIDAFANILLTAGIRETQSALHENIATRFGDKVAIIVKGAQKLRKAIGEEVTSCDFEVLYVLQDTEFKPSTMDDAFAGDYEKGREEPEPVLCTTDLGIARVVRKPGKVGDWDETILLRPKIVLQSGIEEMMVR